MPERRPGAEPIPLSTLVELDGWVLDIRCSKCRLRTRYPVDLLAERIGKRHEIMRVVLRLRCKRWLPIRQQCGGKPDHVALLLFKIYGKSVNEIRRVVVLGDVG